ncbi:MAG: LLM class F420-dependent oxidoreductase [bacterium]|nr:LLM class F420-dependent oxidoreductase [bacterium]
MEIGVRLPRRNVSVTREDIRDFATTAERLGFDGLWVTDHLAIPLHIESLYPLGRQPTRLADGELIEQMGANLEMLTTLAYLAAITDRIRLCTGVAVLPIRNPVLTARQLATIDHLSGGRVICGVGVGWLREEVDAVGLPWEERGARAEEQIELMRTLWTAQGELVEFNGRFWQLPPMSPHPLPVQRPIPILIGGHSPTAIERAGRLGDGWATQMMSPERLATGIASMRDAAERHGRDPATLLVHTTARMQPDVSPLDHLSRVEEVGADHVRYDLETIDELNRLADEVLV